MADYKLLFASIKTPADIQGELPLETLTRTNTLNAPGLITGTVPLDPYGPHSNKQQPIIVLPTAWYEAGRTTSSADLFVTAGTSDAYNRTVAKTLFGPASFGTARTVVYVERDGTIMKGGILWGINASVETGTLTFLAEGWLSYFRRRTVQYTLTYTTTDQDTIARNLIDHAQSFGGGDIGVDTTTANPHGVTRDRSYPWHGNINVGEALENLAAVDDGFDFDFVSSYGSSGTIETTFNTSYPSTGRPTNHVFELGTNIEIVSYTESGADVANQSRAFGSGIGTEVLTETRTNSANVVTYPLLERNTSHPSVVRPTTLATHALRNLSRGSEPVTGLSVHVHPDAIPGVGSYEVGDRVSVTADRGYIQLDKAQYRIVSHGLTVDATGESSVVELAPLGLFT